MDRSRFASAAAEGLASWMCFGCKSGLWATRKVRLMHVGQGYFPNFQEWGTEAKDHASGEAPLVAGMCPLLDSRPANPVEPPMTEAISR